MTGILEAFAELSPSWEQLAWAWAVSVREDNAARERSRVAPRVRRSHVIGSSALSPVQKRAIVARHKRGATTFEIAKRERLTPHAVRAYLSARAS